MYIVIQQDINNNSIYKTFFIYLKMRKIQFLILFFIFCNLNAFDKKDFYYGIYADYGINILDMNFGALPNVPNCCNEFSTGNGIAYSFGGVAYYKLSMLNPKFKVGLRLNYYNSTNEFNSLEKEVLSVDNAPYNGQFEHNLTTNVSYINFYPVIEYNFYDKLNFNLGVNFRIPITTNFTQYEKIVDPIDRGVFEDSKTNIRNQKSDNIKSINNLNSVLSFAVNYSLPLNKHNTLIAKPEIGFDYALTSSVNDIHFFENRIKVGIEILYNYQFIPEPLPILNPPPPPIPVAIVKEEPKNEMIAPDIEFDFVGVDSAGIESQVLEITARDRNNFTLKPMLTYVFFLEDSYTIRKEYRDLTDEEVEKFDIDSVKSLPTMDIYYNVMNVVAKRLKQRPQSKITLIACNSDENLELNDLELSKKRAFAVRDYFLNTWKIDSNRIKIELRNLPSLPSNINHNDGIVENRRVEIHSTDWEIVKPIIDEEFYTEFNYPKLKIYLNDKNKNSTKKLKWNLKVLFEGNNVFSQSGKEFRGNSIEILLDRHKFFIVGDEKLDINLEFEDEYGNKNTQKASIPFKIVDNPDEKYTFIERAKYNLILFEFDKSRLTEANQRIVDIINNRIHPNSTGIAYAYTDRTGTEEHNLELSDRRAKSIVNYIKIKDIKTEGRGESILLYDNQFPEGRFYCRTTEIIVETEITR